MKNHKIQKFKMKTIMKHINLFRMIKIIKVVFLNLKR